MELYMIFFLIALIVAIGRPLYLLMTREKRRQAVLEAGAEEVRLQRFDKSHGQTTIQGVAGIPIMFVNNQLLSATLDIQYVAQSKANLGSAVRRAAIGGVAAGPIGMAVGAAAGSRSECQLISAITVYVTGKDGCHKSITFYSGKPLQESELIAQMNAARSAVARLQAAIF